MLSNHLFDSVYYGSQVYDRCVPCIEDCLGIFLTALLENRCLHDVMLNFNYRNFIDYG